MDDWNAVEPGDLQGCFVFALPIDHRPASLVAGLTFACKSLILAI